MKNEIVLYESNDLSSRIEVRVEEDTVWLNRQQISDLFSRDVKTIGKHINNVFSEGELIEKATVANFATVQNEGGRKVVRQIEYYNLDDKAHDRFLIIDEKTVYHFGASLKDLGKKWFAFSRMDISAVDMLKEAVELV
jgi:hypothetical protein